MERIIDPLNNLRELFLQIVATILVSFPYVVAIIFILFILVLAFLGSLFPSISF